MKGRIKRFRLLVGAKRVASREANWPAGYPCRCIAAPTSRKSIFHIRNFRKHGSHASVPVTLLYAVSTHVGGEMRKEDPEQDGTPAPEEEPLDELSLRFLKAIRDRDEVGLLQRVVDEGASLTAKDPDGQTALHLAIHNGDTSMVQFLLEKGADPEATAPNGNKPLYDAAESGYLEIVELLLDFNANVEAFNMHEQRTAFYQVSLSCISIAYFLIVCSEPEHSLFNF